MTQTTVQVTEKEALAESQDRFHRFGLIEWWDQKRLSCAKVLVVGAGALGNELIKNLALLGVGNILVADMDRIENSNLSRSVLYREQDNGQSKAEVAALAAKDIYPDCNVHYFDGNVTYDLGLGVYRWADLVLAGLDNREARLAINRACWKVGRPWIDGAIEQIQGIARVFDPSDDSAPCYECTMSETDWKLLQMRRSCNLLSRQEMVGGKTPTTPTIGSIIAGIQVQEAVKLLHGMPSITGKGLVFNGMTTETWPVQYQRNQECHSHCAPQQIISLEIATHQWTGQQLIDHAAGLLGKGTVIELSREVLAALTCTACGDEQAMYASLGSVGVDHAACPKCGQAHRDVKTFHELKSGQPAMDRSLHDLGIPPYDMVIARNGDRRIGLEFVADAKVVLGPLAGNEEAIQWS